MYVGGATLRVIWRRRWGISDGAMRRGACIGIAGRFA